MRIPINKNDPSKPSLMKGYFDKKRKELENRTSPIEKYYKKQAQSGKAGDKKGEKGAVLTQKYSLSSLNEGHSQKIGPAKVSKTKGQKDAANFKVPGNA